MADPYEPQVPLSDVYDELGRQRYAPTPAPSPLSPAGASLYSRLQPYPINVPAAIEGLMMQGGVTGGPAGAVRQGLGELASGVGNVLSPAGRYLAGGLGLGAGGAAALTPTEAQTPNADPRIARIQQYDAEIAQNRAKLEAMATQTFKSTAARNAASKPYNDAIELAQGAKQKIIDEL